MSGPLIKSFTQCLYGHSVTNSHMPQEVLPFGVIITKPATGSGFDYTSVLTNAAAISKTWTVCTGASLTPVCVRPYVQPKGRQ